MISYYPNLGHLNEAFDKCITYKQSDAEAEKEAQSIYELCVFIYKTGFKDGVDKMTANVIKTLRGRA